MTRKKDKKLNKTLVLDTFEQEIENSVTANFKPVYISVKEKAEFEKVAKQHLNLKKSKRINIRINNEDLIKVKSRAKQNNIPYQTMLGSLIHKYAKGEIKLEL